MTTASEVHTVYYVVQWYSKQVSGDFGHNETCLHSSYVYRFIQYAKDVKNMIKNMTLIVFGGQKNVQKNVPGNLICTQNSLDDTQSHSVLHTQYIRIPVWPEITDP